MCSNNENTCKTVNDYSYGARPDDNGPIGGGSGYKKIVTQGDYIVRDTDSLLAALEKIKTGEVIFIERNAEIDCTALTFTEKFQIKLPAGVTLASDRGHKGSEGAIIRSDNFSTSPLISRP